MALLQPSTSVCVHSISSKMVLLQPNTSVCVPSISSKMVLLQPNTSVCVPSISSKMVLLQPKTRVCVLSVSSNERWLCCSPTQVCASLLTSELRLSWTIDASPTSRDAMGNPRSELWLSVQSVLVADGTMCLKHLSFSGSNPYHLRIWRNVALMPLRQFHIGRAKMRDLMPRSARPRPEYASPETAAKLAFRHVERSGVQSR